MRTRTGSSDGHAGRLPKQAKHIRRAKAHRSSPSGKRSLLTESEVKSFLSKAKKNLYIERQVKKNMPPSAYSDGVQRQAK